MAVAAPALDLKQLPLRALLAYAARCARRVQSLFTIAPEHADPAQAAQAIDTAIRLGEEFAAGADLDPQILAQAEEAVVQILMTGGSGDGLEKGAAYAANAAYGVISATRAAVESDTADDPAAAAQLVTECATIVADAAIAADPSVERAARLDWEMLHRMRLGKFPALGDAINPAPTGMLGPLFCSQTRRSNDENTAGDRLTGREPPRRLPSPEPEPREEPSDSLRLDRIDPPKKQVSPQIQELVGELQEQRKQIEEEAAALREEKEAFELARSVFKDDHQRKKNELKAEQDRLKSLAADLERHEENLAHRDEEFAEREEELSNREKELSRRDEELSRREANLADREQKLSEAEAALNEAREKFAEEQSRVQSENAAGADLQAQLDGARAQLEKERAELESQRVALHEQVEQFQAAVEAFQAEKARAGEAAGSELSAELQNERMEKEQLQKQMRMAQQEFERLESEKQELAAELERLRSAAAGAPEPAAPVRTATERAPAREPAPRPRPAAPAPRAARDEELAPVRFLIEPGTATSMQLAELLHEMNILYRQLGGDGIRYQMGECRVWTRPDGSDLRRSVVELRAAPAPPPGGLKGTIDPTLWEQLRSCLVMSMSVDEGLTTCFAESQTAPDDHPAHRLVASAAKRAMTAYAARRNDGSGGGGLPIDAVNVQVKRIEQFLRALAKEKCCLLEISTAEFQSHASSGAAQPAPQAEQPEKRRGWFGRRRS